MSDRESSLDESSLDDPETIAIQSGEIGEVSGNKRAQRRTNLIPGATDMTNRDKYPHLVRLRNSGRTYQEMAEALNYSSLHLARKHYLAALKHGYPDVELAVERQTTINRFDAMIRAIWIKVMQGDLYAIDRVLRIESQRAALLGLNAPLRINVAAIIGTVADEFGLSADERKSVVEEVETYLTSLRESGVAVSTAR